MSDDLEQRLRERAERNGTIGDKALFREAAAELARLREALAQAEREREAYEKEARKAIRLGVRQREDAEARADRAEQKNRQLREAVNEAQRLLVGLLNGGTRAAYEWASERNDWFYVTDLMEALEVSPTHANNYARLLAEDGLLVRERGDTPVGGGRTFRYRIALGTRKEPR